MRISARDLTKYDLNEEKKKSLTYVDRYFYRPFANLLVPFLFNVLKLSPNMISVLSLIVAIIGFAVIMVDYKNSIYLGVLLLMVWAVLDCADGSLARVLFYKYQVKNPLGEFFDAFAGYGVIAGLWFSLGWASFCESGNVAIFLIGAFSAILGLLSRVSYNKLSLVKIKNGIIEETNSRQSTLYFIYENLEFGSLLFPVVLIAIYFQLLPEIIFTYFLINILMFFWLCRKIVIDSGKLYG